MASGMIHPNLATLHPSVVMNQSDVEYNASLPREGLAFHQVQQAVRDYEREQTARRAHREVVPVEGQTLDLSMPKKRDSSTPQPYGAPPTAHNKDSQLKPQQQQHYRSDPMAGMRAPAPYPPRSTPPAQNNATRPLGGSIMQGTPFSPQMSLQVPRTDGLLRPAVHQGRSESMAGSITQGTPILVKDHSSPYEQAGLSYYKIPPQSSSPSPSQPGAGGGGGGQQRGAQYSSDPQQFSSRQIILTDYLLSQQMTERNSNSSSASGSRRDREPPLSQQQQQPQQLQRPDNRGPPQLQPGQPSLYQPYRPPSPMYLPGRSPYGMEPVHHGYPPHSSGGSSGHPTAPSPHLQHPPQQPTPPQQQQQRQGVIQRNSSVPSGRQSDPRPSPPAPTHLIHQQVGPGRTSSPSQPAAGGGATGRPGSMMYLGPVSPRGESIYGHDAFASLVNAAAAQPSLPVPDRDRRDRERDKDPRPGLVTQSRY